MKRLFLVALLFVIAGCRETSTERQMNLTSGKALYDIGFLKFADSINMITLKQELIDSFDIYDENNGKIAFVDAEELAEFSFDFFMPELGSMLEKRKFSLDVRVADNHDKSNEVLINGRRVRLYTKEEMDKNEFWDTAPRNFFKEINRQLDSVGVGESFYLLYGGNDLHVMLLTKGEQKIIADHFEQDIKEVPYKP